jgi:hypothetical protein
MLISVGVLQGIPASAEGGSKFGVPSLNIFLDPGSQGARVTGNASGCVQFTGSVQVQFLPVERIVVALTSSVDIGWASRCSPGLIVITDGASHSFSVTVVVPQATPSNIIGTLKVDAKGQGGGFECQGSTQVIVTVKPYYRPKLAMSTPYKEIAAGGKAFFSLKVCNDGNSVDSYEMGIQNPRELVSKGWTITIGGQPAKINPGEYKTWRITAQPPRGFLWKDEATTIIVKATSLNAREESSEVFDTIQIVVYQRISVPDPVVIGSTFWTVIFAAMSAVWMARLSGKKRKRGEA